MTETEYLALLAHQQQQQQQQQNPKQHDQPEPVITFIHSNSPNLHPDERPVFSPKSFSTEFDSRKSRPPRFYVVDMPVAEQNSFLRKCFGLIFIALLLTLVVSYKLIDMNQVSGWVTKYPWMVAVIGFVSIVVIGLYLTPWFRNGGLALQLVTYVCVIIVCTVIVTLLGTYVPSGMLFRSVAVAAVGIAFMFLYTLQSTLQFNTMFAYFTVVIIWIASTILLIWLPNRDYFGEVPNADWLHPPGTTGDVFWTSLISVYILWRFISSVTTTMETRTPDQFIGATISAYIDIVMYFGAWFFQNVLASRGGAISANGSGGGGGGGNGNS